ncbi:MAG: alpha/beta hydrolase [Verrucomicrobiales bacterium]|nr:alpha/beta hydrolase [Verrucomicrobiales bacterium]
MNVPLLPFARYVIGGFVWLSALGVALAADPAVALWRDKPPGEKQEFGPEQDLTKPNEGLVGGKRLIRLGNVTQPTLQVFRPEPAKANGAAVLVCPGGAYNILALDLEGTEVCEWLNSMGVTGVLLKYRVPRREGLEKHAAALQDAQRAMGLIRQNAGGWGIDPKRVGVLGFSAGGHLSAALSNTPERTYPKADGADDLSCRPDFTVLVYPAYLTVAEENDRMANELKITTNSPPAFVVMTQDDPIRVENAVQYSAALKRVGVPSELHVYPKGGHGYGLRRTELPVTGWPTLAAEWLKAGGWLAKATP